MKQLGYKVNVRYDDNIVKLFNGERILISRINSVAPVPSEITESYRIATDSSHRH